MQYRTYGNTGIRISALGFGAMRLPQDEELAVKCIQRSFELGVNYLDTAAGYGESERICGIALKGWRDKVYVSTKVWIGDDCSGKAWREQFERSLQRLQTDHIDFHVVYHSVTWDGFNEKFKNPGQGLEEALKAREEGKIRHITMSCHDTPENMIKLIDTGLFEGMTVQYNLLDRRNEEAIAYAHDKGLGVVIMGPVAGGRLAAPSEKIMSMLPGQVKSTPELALRFVLSNPNVTCAISGMNSLQMVEENCATASREEPLTAQEREAIVQALEENKRLAELYCTGCNYCMPCPNGVGIPQNFEAMNLHRVWGLTDLAKAAYRRLGDEHPEKLLPASACVACGECEPKCPQKIPIIAQLKETAEALQD
jgi:predicted aldo/keto reductase-like oxidoreductase